MSGYMHGHKIIKVLGGVVCVAILVAVAFVVHTFQGGNLQKARQIAVRLQTAAMANPSPVASAADSTGAAAAGTAISASPATSPTAANGARLTAGGQATAAAVPSNGAGGAASAATASAARSSAPISSASAAAAAAAAQPAVKTPSAATPRRRPSSAEVGQAIVAVHALLPFFTPTADQIASVGNQVCTSLDQGTSFAQVKSQALDIVGAGSISWMIPSSVPEIAIRTVVALYCPTNASKLH